MISKRVLLNVISTLGLSLYSISASADYYAGVLASYSNAEYKQPASTLEANPYVLQGQLGYFFNDYLALEARYGTSIQRDNNLNIDSITSAFTKFNIPVSNRIAVYGLAGYSFLQMDQQNVGSNSEESFSFGLGMHYALDTNNAVTFEFVDVSSHNTARLNTISIGFQHRF
ncbi:MULTISPECIES: porin family protein [unclassified Vibrio]|uniref:porin family protein n=1 Tax=unclassified Vibrio TaxID=2614977 RepID=UPI002964C3A4|nr:MULTISPECIES: porin family protein [unclassified Vibrio]MDW2276071.1 porin family protein [Vibrio sp. 1074]MDW2287193.1 porin family protein [Vibrio sp. 1562]MDW3123397.1 porin family protein [Vibrio sp. 1974]